MKLTAELEGQILASIRAGGYPHVAAAAWGVPDELWQKWRQQAGKKGGWRYRDFFAKVEQAQGQARLKAEMAALDADPRFWLKHGLGKEQSGHPGWSAMPRPLAPCDAGTDVLLSPELLHWVGTLRAALAAYPEALAALTQMMDNAS